MFVHKYQRIYGFSGPVEWQSAPASRTKYRLLPLSGCAAMLHAPHARLGNVVVFPKATEIWAVIAMLVVARSAYVPPGIGAPSVPE